MQPTSPQPPLLALAAPSGDVEAPVATSTSSLQRVEERPQSPLAQGSYAWPAWAVIGVALLTALGCGAWWTRLQKRRVVRGANAVGNDGGNA